MHLIAGEIHIPDTFNAEHQEFVVEISFKFFFCMSHDSSMHREQKKTSFKVWNEMVFEIEKDLNYWKFCTIFNITESSLAHKYRCLLYFLISALISYIFLIKKLPICDIFLKSAKHEFSIGSKKSVMKQIAVTSENDAECQRAFLNFEKGMLTSHLKWIVSMSTFTYSFCRIAGFPFRMKWKFFSTSVLKF